METVKYNKSDVEMVLNILNGMEYVGFQNAGKLTTIFQILNSPIVEKNEMDGNGSNK